MKVLFLAFAVTLLSFPAAAQQPDPESERAMERNLAREFEQSVTLLKDSTVVEYVNRIGQNIVKNSDATIPFTIKVNDSPEINVFGLPGGFLYVNTGMINAADNEAQLAAMISHAVAHVTSRHAAKQAGKAAFINILSLPSTTFPIAAFRQSLAPRFPTMFYAFSRGAETEADFLGLQNLYKSGYEPSAMAAFFRKMAGQSERKVSSLFDTHPPTSDRATKSEESVKTLPPRQQNIVDTPEFQDIKKRLP